MVCDFVFAVIVSLFLGLCCFALVALLFLFWFSLSFGGVILLVSKTSVEQNNYNKNMNNIRLCNIIKATIPTTKKGEQEATRNWKGGWEGWAPPPRKDNRRRATMTVCVCLCCCCSNVVVVSVVVLHVIFMLRLLLLSSLFILCLWFLLFLCFPDNTSFTFLSWRSYVFSCS